MFGIFVVFSLIAAGSLVCLSAGIALRLAARKAQAESVAMGPGRAASQSAPVQVDPTVTFGFIIACYGVIALILVSALPGELALERSLLAYALLCVGGLIAQIAMTGTASRPQTLEALDMAEEAPGPHKPVSLGLSAALILLLNLAFALLICAQGVIDIVPPAKSSGAARGSELDPIVVIAERTPDSLER